MKLLSYHIENYGKLHNIDGQFDVGLTEFCEHNGYGKTTMASFIRAMFYGLPSYTTKTKAFDDRQHFYPFEGGKFGGNLAFEMQGKIYKIERFFDKKSSKGDECKVYQNGVPFTGFGEDIGKEVFGLDEESFKKTVFITVDEIEIESTYAINEKLNRDVIGGEDSDYESAIETLEKAKKSLKAGRGNNDLISIKKAEILDLTARIKNLQDMSEGLSGEYVERDRLAKEIAGFETELKSAGEYDLILQKWETLDNLTVQTEQKRNALQGYREKYPQGAPTEEERKNLRVCMEEEARLSGALQSVAFGEDKQNILTALSQKFARGVPTQEEIAVKQQGLTRLATLTAETNAWKNRQRTEREKELARCFADGAPTEETLAVKRAEAEEYKRQDAQLKALHNALVRSAPTQTKKSFGKPLCFALAALCVIVGGVLAGIQIWAVGVPLLAIGLALGCVGFYLHSKGKTNQQSNGDIAVKIAETQARMRVLEEKLRAFTVQYRYYSEAGAAYDFMALEEAVRAYRLQMQAEIEGEKRFVAAMQEIQEIQTQTQTYLVGYGEAGDLREGLNRLLSSASAYQSLMADKASANEKTEDLRTRILQCQATVKTILQTYELDAYVGTMSALNGLELDCKRMQELMAEVADLEKNLTDYKEKNGLTERPQGQVQNTEDLHARLSVLRKQLADCDKRIAEIERVVEQLPDTESELEQAEEVLEVYKQRYQLLTDTIDALKNAEKSLKDRYVAPIKNRFSHYAEALERVLDEKISMDSDYRVKFERGGEERSDRHLSAGERSLCALCLRLALIDNMYETEQPFIVMDDPFVHLDETHLRRVSDLMKTLAQERQIIYFCCHESRSML